MAGSFFVHRRSGKKEYKGSANGYMNKRGENIIEGAPYCCLGHFPEICVRPKFYGVEVRLRQNEQG
ncbi:Uncharacterized protein APZ42_000885 [Daphnia magna]|uniref:Uncharacterized protein n=1 Tax=Daphnia magna TaxID=35525 RepID=A0A164JBB0_9CRUS|nr:Uncharacterized protein APZ42_000885 [Daphnia magna]